jgi:ArsR family transcriptional regulator
MAKQKQFEREAEILKTIGHPVRLKIIKGLMDSESCVKDIWKALKLPQATVSQHLALLKNRKIVSSERKGVTMCYSVTDDTVKKIMRIVSKG